MLLRCRSHPSLQAKSSCLNSPCNGNVLDLLKRPIYHQTMKKNRPRLSLCSMFGGLLSRPLEMRHSRMYLYGHPCLCTQHYSSDESWAFWICSIFCPLQVRTRTTILNLIQHMKGKYFQFWKMRAFLVKVVNCFIYIHIMRFVEC